MGNSNVSHAHTLFDTNVVLYFLGGRLLEPLPPGLSFISVITEIELLSYPSLSAEEETHVRNFLSKIAIIGLDPEIKETAITFRRQYHLKVPDAIIAASAKVLHATLLTNDSSLLKIPEIRTTSLKIRESSDSPQNP